MRLLLLTCVEQYSNCGIGDSVKREITQGLQERHGAEKGIAITADSSCRFYDFATWEGMVLSGSRVRLRHSTTLPPAADMQLTPHAATADGRRHCAVVRQPGAVQAPEGDRLGKQGLA